MGAGQKRFGAKKDLSEVEGASKPQFVSRMYMEIDLCPLPTSDALAQRVDGKACDHEVSTSR